MGKQKEDFFTVKDNVCYIETRLLLELWVARSFSFIEDIKKALVVAIKAIKVTLLEVKLHHFPPNREVSSVAVISQSHINIHTRPEFDYTTIDIFVCGKVNPYRVVSIFKNYFSPNCDFTLPSYIENYIAN